MAHVGSSTGSWHQYSAWVKNIARNMKFIANSTNASVLTLAQVSAIRTFILVAFDPQNLGTCTRPWLRVRMCQKSVRVVDYYSGNARTESVPALIGMLEVIGRDLKKIPLTAAEKTAADTLIAATGTLRLGSGVRFGSTIGTVKTTPGGIVS